MANLNELPPLVPAAAYEERPVSPSVTEFDDGGVIYLPANTPNLSERLCPSYSEEAKILVRKLPLAPLISVDSVSGQSIERALASTKSIVSRLDGKINFIGVGSISVGGKELNILAALTGNRTKNTLPTVRCLTSGEGGITSIDFPLVVSCKRKNGVTVPYDLKVSQRTYSDKLFNCARLYEKTQVQQNPRGAQIAQRVFGTETTHLNQINQLPPPCSAPQFFQPRPFSPQNQLPQQNQHPQQNQIPQQNQLPQENQLQQQDGLHLSYYWAKVLISVQNTNPPQLGYGHPTTVPYQVTQPFRANPQREFDQPPQNNFPPSPNPPQLGGYGPQVTGQNLYNQLHQVNLQHQMNPPSHTPNANRTPRPNTPYQANHPPHFNH